MKTKISILTFFLSLTFIFAACSKTDTEEFAKKLSIKESLLNKIENSSFKPSLPLAQKLENVLKIKLIEEVEETKMKIAKGATESVTVGDLIDFE